MWAVNLTLTLACKLWIANWMWWTMSGLEPFCSLSQSVVCGLITADQQRRGGKKAAPSTRLNWRRPVGGGRPRLRPPDRDRCATPGAICPVSESALLTSPEHRESRAVGRRTSCSGPTPKPTGQYRGEDAFQSGRQMDAPSSKSTRTFWIKAAQSIYGSFQNSFFDSVSTFVTRVNHAVKITPIDRCPCLLKCRTEHLRCWGDHQPTTVPHVLCHCLKFPYSCYQSGKTTFCNVIWR